MEINFVNTLKMKRAISFFTAFILLLSVINAQEIPKWKITKLQSYIKESKSPIIITFWATYCKPCVQELPYFQELVKKYESAGIKLLLVSLDFEQFYPEKIKRFADKQKYTAPIVWLNESNADYFCPKIDSSWTGVMPATVLVNNKTGYRNFFEAQISKEKMEMEIKKLIGL